MRQRGAAVAAAFIIGAGAFAAPVVGHADAVTTFYVNDAGKVACSDATTNSSVTPYCTIQAAVDAATEPGDVVDIKGGAYAPFTVTASGTAVAPIMIESEVTGIQQWWAQVMGPSSATTPVVSVDGASYVDITGFWVDQQAPFAAVSVSNSSHIDIDNGHLNTWNAAATVAIDGSSDVTVSRSEIWAEGKTASVLDVQGGSRDILTTNQIEPATGAIAVTLDGTTGSAVTGNSILRGCSGQVEVKDGATSSSIQNNQIHQLTSDGNCPATPASSAALAVDASSTTGTILDYNDVDATPADSPGVAPYEWADRTYATAAALDSATGQGAHDVNTSNASALVDSANSAAPGEMTTDDQGNPRVDDPLVANTGTGPRSYDDRGAVEAQDAVVGTPAANWPTSMPVGGTATFTTSVADAWSDLAVASCSFIFQDGSDTVVTTPQAGKCTAQHTYDDAGSFYPSVEVTMSDGSSTHLDGVALKVAGSGGPAVVVSAQTDGARDATIGAGGSDPWNLIACHIDFGDDTSTDLKPSNCSTDHHYAKPGTYPITLTFTDSGGNTRTVTGSFAAVGDYYNPVAPLRVLDTRKAIGVPSVTKVAPGGVLKLRLAGADGIPTDAAAVALNLTVTDATGGGYATAYPDGTATPSASTLNFSAGQAVPNLTVVKLGADGAVDVKNSSTGTVDFVADLEGYYAATGQGYTPYGPLRVVDTRKTKTTIPAGGTLRVDLYAAAGTTAAVLNTTVTNTASGGYITAYPDGTTVPTASNLNFAKGQTVANQVIVKTGANGYVDFKNSSPDKVDLVVDLEGAFQTTPGAAYVPIAPTRVLDTRKNLGIAWSGGFGPDASSQLTITRPASLAAHQVLAVAGNLTVTGPSAGGFISLAPPTSSLNFSAGQTIANAVTASLAQGSAQRYLTIYNEALGTTQIIFDVDGYFVD